MKSQIFLRNLLIEEVRYSESKNQIKYKIIL
jgi:hypothetical protein